jgi:uncharacterized protein (TIGR02996 family)
MAKRIALDALERAVREDPDDDAARAVLADALLEAGDPRGEFIAIQLRPERTDEQRAREKALLARHAKTWLGPLARVLVGYRFERGFLAAATIDRKKPKLVAELVGHPAWETVTELAGSARIALDPSLRVLRVLELSSADAEREGLPDAWRDLLIDRRRPIEKLVYLGPRRPSGSHLVHAGELDAVTTCSALPGLRALTVIAGFAPGAIADALAKAPVCKRLQSLEVGGERHRAASALTPFAPLIAAAPVPRLAVTIGDRDHPTRCELDQRSKGYTRARLVIGPASGRTPPPWQRYFADEGVAIVHALPRGVKRIAFEPREKLGAAAIAEIQAAIAEHAE